MGNRRRFTLNLHLPTQVILRKAFRGLLIGFVIAAFLNILFSLGLFKSWQDKLSDTLFLSKAPLSDIVVVAIDDKSILALGRFPWDRNIYAKFLDKISNEDSKPASLGLDIPFFEPTGDSDNALAAALSKAGNVTLAAQSNTTNDILSPIDILSKESKFGIANTYPDSDGVTRFAKLKTVGSDGKNYDSFSYLVSKIYLKNTNKTSTFLDGIENRFPIMRINFIGGPTSYSTYSFSDILDGKVDGKKLKGKIVLVGATAQDLHDNQVTPTSGGSPMSGIEIQANTIQTMLQERFLREETKAETLITFFLIPVIASAVLILMPVTPMIISLIVISTVYVFYTITSFDRGIIRNLIYPFVGIGLVGLTNIIYKYFSEFRQKRFLRKAFSFYLSESVLSEILSNPSKLKLGGERKEMTVLFSDIAGFTSIAEKMNPEDLVHMLNNYLTRMTNIVFKYNGVLDKYVGDSVMAFWGAPIKETNHALLACKAAFEMYQEIAKIRRDWANFGLDFDIRIGINSGEMIVGNMGSDQRFDYTLIGDNVNLGSRLEGINKEYGTNIIISEATYQIVKDHVTVRKLDTVAVKGKDKGVAIYELRGFKDDLQNPELLKEFEIARSLYQNGYFTKAGKFFEDLSIKYPNDKPVAVFLERCRTLAKQKPRNWDGIYHSNDK